ncbi:MAG: hypothetical protein H6707_19390 [Deltaproteobacteria bacterium]|nr:hypothetical protein [Deltaproteobacteria bacterium]
MTDADKDRPESESSIFDRQDDGRGWSAPPVEEAREEATAEAAGEGSESAEGNGEQSSGGRINTGDEEEGDVPQIFSGKQSADQSGWVRDGVDHAADPEARQVFAPLASGPGSGEGFFFLFGLNRYRGRDQEMLKRELAAIQDDIEVLRKAGYTVVIDKQATRATLRQTLAGAQEAPAAGIYWSAHGNPDGSVETSDGKRIRPDDIDPERVRSELRLFIMSACYSAARSRAWRDALGGRALVVGWGRPVTIDRAVDFLTPRDDTDNDLDDLIRRYLLERQEPPAPADEASEEAVSSYGEIEKLKALAPSIAEALRSPWREKEDEKLLQINVALESGRTQIVNICVVQSLQPFTEGQPLFAVEAGVGELTSTIDINGLLGGFATPGAARLALTRGKTRVPLLVVQGFIALESSSLEQMAGVVLEVAKRADDLEHRMFGGDVG